MEEGERKIDVITFSRRPHPIGWLNRYLSVISILLAIFIYFAVLEPLVVGYFKAKYDDEVLAEAFRMLLFRHTNEYLEKIYDTNGLDEILIFIGLRHILRSILVVLLSVFFRFKKKRAFFVWSFFITPLIAFILPQEAPVVKIIQPRLVSDMRYEEFKTIYDTLMRFLDIDQAFIITSLIFVGVYLMKAELERRGSEYVFDPKTGRIISRVCGMEHVITLENVEDIVVLKHPIVKDCVSIVFIEEGEERSEKLVREKAKDLLRSVYYVKASEEVIEDMRMTIRGCKFLKKLILEKMKESSSSKGATEELEDEETETPMKVRTSEDHKKMREIMERIISNEPKEMYV